MRRLIYLLILVFALPAMNGCKKFLNVVPLDNESGNNYWKTKKDVEQFTLGLYNILRSKTAIGSYFFVVGDLRCSPWKQTEGGSYNRTYITHLATNDLNDLLSQDASTWDPYFGFTEITRWQDFYQLIQGANLEYTKVDGVPDPSMSAQDKDKYKAEAVFLRCLSYFLMVRVYGDVPYYTNAYQSAPLPRTNMVTVLQNCIKDLGPVTENLPWTYTDPANRAVRAMRGSALVLQMHMYMWLAGFDDPNKEKYWQAVDSLGAHLLNDNQGAYELLPLEETKEIFDGRSKEGLFEIPQNLNYGESFGYSTFSDLVLHYPHKQPASNSKSYMYPDTKFLNQVYPSGQPDKRVDYWFEPDEMYKTDGSFEYLKYTNIFAQEGEDVNPNDNLIVFRLPDAILLRAEALNDLGKDDEACTMLNLVRARAGATPYKGTGSDLSDEIYWERCRELLGEGYYFYTLVRTKKILDPKYCWHPMTVEAFKEGAWTWPIDPSALDHNPFMTLNNYWLK